MVELWVRAVERWECCRAERTGTCGGLDVALRSDSLRYFNGWCVECVAAGHSPRIRSSVTSSRPVCFTKWTGPTYTKNSLKLDPGPCSVCVPLRCLPPYSLVLFFNIQLWLCLTSEMWLKVEQSQVLWLLNVCEKNPTFHLNFAKLMSAIIRFPARMICPGGPLWLWQGFNKKSKVWFDVALYTYLFQM